MGEKNTRDNFTSHEIRKPLVNKYDTTERTRLPLIVLKIV